jgi:hypothetical protein
MAYAEDEPEPERRSFMFRGYDLSKVLTRVCINLLKNLLVPVQYTYKDYLPVFLNFSMKNCFSSLVVDPDLVTFWIQIRIH